MNSFVELGIRMDHKVNLINYINATISKSRSSFGFVKRCLYNDPFTTIILFVSLVRPVLECDCIIHTPYDDSHIMDSLWNRFKSNFYYLRGNLLIIVRT